MKKLFFSLIFSLLFVNFTYAEKLRIDFTAPPNSTWKTWVLYSLTPNIEDSIENGIMVENINGQISELGETFVEASGFVAGKTYYFTAVREDLDGNKSKYAVEKSFDIPRNNIFHFENLPPIEIEDHTFILEIIFKAK